MKINNKPMSALPSVADTPADTGRSCVRLFGLYTILPKVLRVVVEVLFLYHLITGFYHLEPFFEVRQARPRNSVVSTKKATPYGVALDNRGAKGIRTPDPLHAMEMRYQLRHSPKVCPANSV